MIFNIGEIMKKEMRLRYADKTEYHLCILGKQCGGMSLNALLIAKQLQFEVFGKAKGGD